MIYTIYLTNGRIVKIVSTNNIEEQLLDGELYIEGPYADDKFYIENGLAIELPISPGEYYIFDYETKMWVDNRTEKEKYNDASQPVISKRNSLLSASDWTQLPDVPLTTKEAWATYRQALRDISAQSGYPFTIVWPTPPQ
ncbi:Phage tail assembly chaperone protein [uncultured Caudovirales phage]|uniref:Phage tail assembly chaperone protein n=1 Tax=uncultured Caudovirales phage TaxID=2100421 RepID=A0A6J7WQ45_9CAUD|nr:Phage tail assembly chaperone protein [uncultured Caudovirales phage]